MILPEAWCHHIIPPEQGKTIFQLVEAGGTIYRTVEIGEADMVKEQTILAKRHNAAQDALLVAQQKQFRISKAMIDVHNTNISPLDWHLYDGTHCRKSGFDYSIFDRELQFPAMP